MRQLKILKQITDRSNESLNKYFHDISKFDMVPVDEEVELTLRIKKGDLSALEKLITANLRFVVSVAKQYQNKGLGLQDLINEGNVGLIKAAYRFDETRGFKFISYAVWWIRQGIIQAIAEQSRIIRLPLNRISYIRKVNQAIAELEQQFQREPTDEEIAAQADISEEAVKTTHQIKNNHLSMDMPIDNENDNKPHLSDVLDINNIPSPDEKLIAESLRREINMALNKLSKVEAKILEMTYGLNNNSTMSMGEIGDRLGLSKERIRQIKEAGLIKLRRAKNKELLKNYL